MIVQRSQELRSPAMYISFRKVTPGEAKMGLNDTTSISIACFVPQAKILFWPLTIVRSIRWQKYWPRSIFCKITVLDFTLLHIKKMKKYHLHRTSLVSSFVNQSQFVRLEETVRRKPSFVLTQQPVTQEYFIVRAINHSCD